MTALALAPVAAVPSIAYAAEPDPIYAAIEAHRQATAAVYAHPTRGLDDPEFDALVDRQDDAAIALVGETPQTKEGVVALVRYVTEIDQRSGPGEWPDELQDNSICKGTMPFHCWLLRNVLAALEPERTAVA